jgi:hypothetical protein
MTCPICLEEIGEKNRCITPCGHYFCATCIFKSIMVRPTCPLCRSVIMQTEQSTAQGGAGAFEDGLFSDSDSDSDLELTDGSESEEDEEE